MGGKGKGGKGNKKATASGAIAKKKRGAANAAVHKPVAPGPDSPEASQLLVPEPRPLVVDALNKLPYFMPADDDVDFTGAVPKTPAAPWERVAAMQKRAGPSRRLLSLLSA